ncbi:MAG: hypothetical protein Q8Q89_01875 [bacterium]|nr:hypothetical protein [bacterium]
MRIENEASEQLDEKPLQDKQLRVVPRAEKENRETPVLSSETLDVICSLDVGERDRNYFRTLFQDDPKLGWQLLLVLSGRNLKEELPVQEETFAYKRNLKECEKLKKSLAQLISRKKINLEDDLDLKLLDDASILLALERKKAQWLEENFYPPIFEKTIESAQGEVTQFMIKQVNVGKLDDFKDVLEAKIYFKDDLNYLIEGHKPESAGDISGRTITIRTPEYYTDKDEWRVYMVVVHELVHHISHHEFGRLGIEQNFSNPDFKEVNEAVTDILAFYIALDHIEKSKTHLQGQKKPSLLEMPYANYIAYVRLIFSKISVQYFLDALLNEDGLNKLISKFEQELGSKDEFIRFGKQIKGIFNRKAEIIDFPGKKDDNTNKE